jgi:hypothetical protein
VRDPETDREWQDAVDAAKGALALESARTYGLVTGGPDVDVRRCNVILGRGASRRPPVLPSADAVERFLEGR